MKTILKRTARRIWFLVFALAPDDRCCWYRGIDGGYSMVTLPQIRQTDSGPDRERQTAECKDPYQEAVKFSGGFMGRGWGRYWRWYRSDSSNAPPLAIPCDVWTNVWWRGPRDSNPGQVGDRMATPTAPPSYHRPRCDDCRAAGCGWRGDQVIFPQDPVKESPSPSLWSFPGHCCVLMCD